MILDGAREVDRIELSGDRDVVRARRRIADRMDALGARALRKTRFVTAVSEVARNAVVHGGGGVMTVYAFKSARIGIECRDRGPGIASIEQALSDGFSTTGSMGHGLGGAKRLSDAFEIDSRPGGGTVVRMLGSL
ncbi:ATP-binding protein [Pacificimonas flava]|uniref:Histidine kinase/HSP90-like ATPase domain-containing protein n=1 Tax=Pacificimonas flava TaxID=1234595 RepID=M2TBB5_9SPHN|nr:ATP-binding protein [Pacificimonas flava]EMD83894.1 hypothetical protein C725_0866 [Pacificimonas flava]MBB5281131.1 serine/threonine-protein kinase RsbT [Pacificimonas flava]